MNGFQESLQKTSKTHTKNRLSNQYELLQTVKSSTRLAETSEKAKFDLFLSSYSSSSPLKNRLLRTSEILKSPSYAYKNTTTPRLKRNN